MTNFVASNLKELNRRSVYTLLSSENGLSKAEIARRSGISAPTVMKIIDYFEEAGIVVEAGEGSSAIGRKPCVLRYMPDARFAVGVEFDGYHLIVGLVDLSGAIKSLLTKRLDPDIRNFLSNDLAPTVLELLAESGVAPEKIVGLGLGIPCVVGTDHATVSFAPLVGVESPLDLRPYLASLEKDLSMPIVVENDANAAAIGEYNARRLGEDGDLLYLELGRGIGGGLIIGGRLRRGPRAFTGEFGYLIFDPAFTVDSDRPGWLDASIDLSALWAEISNRGKPSEQSLRRIVGFLALAITNICVAVDVALVVVGSAGTNAFIPEFAQRLQEEVNRFSVLDIRCEAPIAPECGVSGAASLATERWLVSFLAGQ